MKNDIKLCFSNCVTGIQTLGPGNRRVIWFQGCSRTPKCPGCASPHLHPFYETNFIQVSFICDFLLDKKGEDELRLTISGGEPLDQPTALIELLTQIRCRYKDILLFTGKRLNDLTPAEAKAAELCDAVIDGEYLSSHDDGLPLRGSSNQTINYMPRCSDSLKEEYESYIKNTKRACQYIPYTNSILAVGIPAHNTYNQEDQSNE